MLKQNIYAEKDFDFDAYLTYISDMFKKNPFAKLMQYNHTVQTKTVVAGMQLLLTAAISGVAAKVIWDIVFVVVAIDPVHYAVFRSEISPLIPVSVLGMLVAPLVAMLHFAPKRSRIYFQVPDTHGFEHQTIGVEVLHHHLRGGS